MIRRIRQQFVCCIFLCPSRCGNTLTLLLFGRISVQIRIIFRTQPNAGHSAKSKAALGTTEKETISSLAYKQFEDIYTEFKIYTKENTRSHISPFRLFSRRFLLKRKTRMHICLPSHTLSSLCLRATQQKPKETKTNLPIYRESQYAEMPVPLQTAFRFLFHIHTYSHMRMFNGSCFSILLSTFDSEVSLPCHRHILKNDSIYLRRNVI